MDFQNKKIAVIGAGVEGISTVNYLVSKGAEVTLLDEKNESEIETEKLNQVKNLPIKLCFGENYLADLDSYDVVFRSPGISPDLAEIVDSRNSGVEITSQTKIFFDLCPCSVVGVTGTKGKGTTSSLIFEILKGGGRDVFLGGNIGVPPLQFIDKLKRDSIAVLELSSFQLIDLEKSPGIAVVLMITSEHLDWHKSVDEYTAAKESIVKYQNEGDFVVVNADFANSKKVGELSKAKKFYFSTKQPVERGAYVDKDFVVSVTDGWTTIVKTDEVRIQGEHNLQNVCAAVAVGGILEIPPDVVARSVKSFRGLPHRLEFVAEIGGAKYYNDSASTTPETAIAAIKAFKNPKIVILGGSTKHSDFSDLGKEVVENDVKAAILIGEEASRIKKVINDAGQFSGEIVDGPRTMGEIVQEAKELAKPGDIVLLSPACASFGLFKNYSDRGDQFKEAVKAIEATS